MTSTATNKLSRQQLQSLLLKHVGSKSDNNSDNTDVTEYDLTKPHYFNKAQMQAINSHLEQLSNRMAKSFSDMCNNTCQAKVTEFAELFSQNVLNALDEKMPYNIAIKNPDETQELGFVSIPKDVVGTWTKLMLGESEQNDEAELSDLELSLFIEMTSALIRNLSDSHPGLNCKLLPDTMSRSIPITMENCCEMSSITFEFSDKEQKDQSQITLVLFSNILEAVSKNDELAKDQPAQNHRELIMENLAEQNIEVNTVFAKIKLQLHDLMNLQPNDVILLDKKIDEPTQLIINGKALFNAMPVKCEDSFGIAVTEIIK